MMVLSKTIGDLLRLDNFCKSSWTTLEEDAFKKEEFENKFKVDVVVYPNQFGDAIICSCCCSIQNLKSLHILEKLVDNVLNEEEKECTMILK